MPEQGGLYDQDYLTMHRMGALDNIYSTVVRVRNLTGHQIHSLTTSERRMIRYLRDLGVMR